MPVGDAGIDLNVPRTGWVAVSASSETFGARGGSIDGNAGTAWITGAGAPQWIIIDMGAAKTFSGIEIVPNQSNAVGTNYTLDVSDDGVTWTNGVETSPTFSTAVAPQVWKLSTSYTHRYFRLNNTANNGFLSVQELYVGAGYTLIAGAPARAEISAIAPGGATGGLAAPVPVIEDLLGTVGVAYSSTVTSDEGTSPFTFSVFSGSLPAGLSLNASTGAITGTPTAAGTSTFTIRATDATGAIGDTTFQIIVTAPSAGGGAFVFG